MAFSSHDPLLVDPPKKAKRCHEPSRAKLTFAARKGSVSQTFTHDAWRNVMARSQLCKLFTTFLQEHHGNRSHGAKPNEPGTVMFQD
ncbi:hypothetical protein PsorP6_007092 [Peronosclerospora sorghi]|uniref:Uncharacterized protein n=1 Tax=Peronosclerospora sorghi TaxID=230839 RepID=A0ACC0WC05_9STRA|nr:hypothetical protein PsorP6_007092 [Peronosclerospora sorghi]